MDNAKYFLLLSTILLSASLITENYFNALRAYVVGFLLAIIAIVFHIKPYYEAVFVKGEQDE